MSVRGRGRGVPHEDRSVAGRGGFSPLEGSGLEDNGASSWCCISNSGEPVRRHVDRGQVLVVLRWHLVGLKREGSIELAPLYCNKLSYRNVYFNRRLAGRVADVKANCDSVLGRGRVLFFNVDGDLATTSKSVLIWVRDMRWTGRSNIRF
jgi:hypothetical protein